LAVLQALDEYYKGYNANVHRGVHHLSARATMAYEAARDKLAHFINAYSRQEVVFTRNASEAINLVAQTWGATTLKPGDEVRGVAAGACASHGGITAAFSGCFPLFLQIILSVAEHHSNLVPWQLIAQKTGAVIKHVKLTKDSQELDLQVGTPCGRNMHLMTGHWYSSSCNWSCKAGVPGTEFCLALACPFCPLMWLAALQATAQPQDQAGVPGACQQCPGCCARHELRGGGGTQGEGGL
jgi:hypothetical protein